MHPSVEIASEASSPSQLRAFLDEVRAELEAGRIAPYLGPGVLPARAAVPTSYRALADLLGKKVALPKRARGNLWASAQYIESQKHRSTIDALMAEAFPSLDPPPLQRYLATLALPLIVDGWYDDAMRRALAGRSDWVEVQGGSRAAVGEARWYRTYAPSGAELPSEAARAATTVLYKPHGAVAPNKSLLVSDADYVEVLTEIDIQTPIPKAVLERRASLGFLYLGCRFHDQTLRIFARQISKRSSGPRFAVIDPVIGATFNERRFLHELGAKIIVAPWQAVSAALAAEPIVS